MGSSLRAAGVEGGVVALITAGWEERESEVDEVEHHMGLPVRNLGLFRRAEQVVESDPELLAASSRLRRRVREHEELYRIRLEPLMTALRRLAAHGSHAGRRAPEIDGTLQMLRDLDDHQHRQMAELFDAFRAKHDIPNRPSLAPHRAELEAQIGEAAAVAIAGGNVAVLYNRLRLFGLEPLLAEKPLLAWSAGAMVLSDRIMLFHDDPPWGGGQALVYGPGLGLVPGLVLMPHARERLNLDDPGRVGFLARRMQPRTCVALDPGDGLLWDGTTASSLSGEARRFTPEGALLPFDGGTPV
ncbi:MAG: Type 1 glutamine amidotransferase-like domain-containing protein [Planctomycetota bacterium]|nr:Type 1 glutamine amidotransferase-like domain-containing protein [Planctomycetota bacterium]